MRRQQACNWLAHQIDPSLFRALQSPLFSIDKTGSFCVPAAAVQQQPGAARVTALSSQDASYIGAGRATGVFQYRYSVMHSCLDLYNSSFLVFELCYNKCVICCVDHQQFWYLHSRQCHDSVSPTQSCRHQQHSSDDSGNCYKQRYVTRHS